MAKFVQELLKRGGKPAVEALSGKQATAAANAITIAGGVTGLVVAAKYIADGNDEEEKKELVEELKERVKKVEKRLDEQEEHVDELEDSMSEMQAAGKGSGGCVIQ